MTGLAAAVHQRLQRLTERVDRGAARLDTLEAAAATVATVTVVASVADLPLNASPRQWFRVSSGTVAERTAVYVGNGPNQPLTKLTPAAL